MACKAIQMWTFPGLVGAFLDLATVYSLLCASTAAYIASKFLSLFGLSLPCPCNGVFGHVNNNSQCVQKVLVDCPLQKISSLNVSVRSKAPFVSLLVSCQNCEVDSHLGKKSVHGSLEDEDSCNSCSEKRLEHSPPINKYDMHFGISDLCTAEERNVAESQKRRLGIRRRRRGSVQYRRLCSSSAHDSIVLDSQYFSVPPSTINSDDETTKESCNDMQHECHMEAPDDKEKSKDITLQENNMIGFGSNQSIDEFRDTSEEVSAAEEFSCDRSLEIGSSRSYKNEKDIIRVLERALREEQLGHANLCLELEKERNAAATAADEAMAMILRLQEEKASIEMEARQFQRITEEKSAFDAEEMNIMMEILVRREKEKYFMEKEVEAYRQLIFANEQLDSELQDTAATQGQGTCSILSSTEKPEMMLRRISKAFDQEELGLRDAETPVMCDITAINCQKSPSNFGEFQVLSADEHDIQNKDMKGLGDEQEESQNTFSGEDVGSNSKQLLGIPRSSSHISNNIDTENDRKGLDICRSCSDIFLGFKANCCAQPKLPSDLRRKSMSAFDYERMKIDSEVGWLRERLKFVQKGRERLNLSAASPEGGNSQLQLLEDIAVQLRKIRQLRDPGKAKRQASLPPLSSKDVLKKRHWRSPSSEEHRSS
ncbi:probable myosin-binding protein 5 isoform X2 [Punica granatum]|uniref:Probable myosin-binding protein 5 isoform X2 n=1 Tax=Punica granatum TaxID=22663 RepID=A0A6P8CDM4_PUNGR|nr:probable myosin-binding protein 5 isoform X2 [Punica granatum]